MGEVCLEPVHPGGKRIVECQIMEALCGESFQYLLRRIQGTKRLGIVIKVEPWPNQACQDGVSVQGMMVGAGLASQAIK